MVIVSMVGGRYEKVISVLTRAGAATGFDPVKSQSYTATCMLRLTPIPGPEKKLSTVLVCSPAPGYRGEPEKLLAAQAVNAGNGAGELLFVYMRQSVMQE